ncbi:MAG TPA: citrate lyase acyl carrier protein [Clostridiales bacterium]|jgi:citrate lyase subunit gamma (acyl carrier protein)|nr:citrate lyase acyl carrier protein [Clostridiales bacterium]
MQIKTVGVAGTMESSDIVVRVEPNTEKTGGIVIHLESNVIRQYGNQIRKVINDTLTSLGVDSAVVTAVDKGALDCTVAARTKAAAFRAAECADYEWGGGK